MAGNWRNAGNLELIGGRLCLDFANTFTISEAINHEYLHSYTDLVVWGRHVGTLTDTEVENLNQAARLPAEAAAAFEQALTLRETIYQIFVAVARQQAPAPADVARLNVVLARAPGYRQILAIGAGFEWQLVQNFDALDSLLWPIAWSAADLLTSTALQQVRQCAHHEGCDWLFLDNSKNQSRRWCSMRWCGSRVKARHYYQRKRSLG